MSHNIKYKCIAIFGGLGFIGIHLAKRLIKQDLNIRIFDQAPTSLFLENFNQLERTKIKYVEGSFLNFEDTNSEFLVGCDSCIHLITTTFPASSNDNITYDIESNLISTVKLLELIRSAGIKKLVFLSSGGTVYGNPKYIPIDEFHSNLPISSYGITKLAIEKYIHLFNFLYGMNGVALRLSNPFGPGQAHQGMQGAISTFVHKARNNMPIEVWGDGSIIRDYIYIDDVVDAVFSALDYCGSESVFNIGAGVGVSLKEIITTLQTMLGKKFEITYSDSRNLDVKENVLDISKAKNILHWSPKYDLSQGLSKYLSEINV